MVLVNGQPLDQIGISDRGFNYGDGLFTTLVCRAGVPLLWSSHVERLTSGCQRLAITAPDLTLIRAEVEQLAAGDDCIIKVVISRGYGGRGYAIAGVGAPNRVLSRHPLPAHRQQWRQQGIVTVLLPQPLGSQPLLAGLKSLNRLEQVLLRQAAVSAGADEGICVDDAGMLVEATAANLWWRANGIWHTPSLERCGVSGVMRQLLLDTFAARGQAVRQLCVAATALDEADELMLTNTTFGLVPVRRYQQREFTGWPAISHLQQELAEVMA
ncbi:MAG: aminodeoxychorismate lyase [Gammaproteobacteria bacterium]|nr:aminodeoxychorismate lyase [Gammaproteobacteria bacterium]